MEDHETKRAEAPGEFLREAVEAPIQPKERARQDDAAPRASLRRSLLLLGPIVLGAVLGIPWGGASMLYEAAVLPSVLFGTVLLMFPALYIGATILGVAPSIQVVLRSFGYGLTSTGALLLGFSPLCAFLLLTNPTETLWAWLLGAGTLTVSLWMGLRTLQSQMFAAQEKSYLWWPLFWGWALVALLIGERLYSQSFRYINA